MEVNWKLVRKALSEIYGLPELDLGKAVYGVGADYAGCDDHTKEKNKCVMDLYDAGYIWAEDVSHSTAQQIIYPRLSDLGSKLLDVLGNKYARERANKIVKESGRELDLISMRDIGLPAIVDK